MTETEVSTSRTKSPNKENPKLDTETARVVAEIKNKQKELETLLKAIDGEQVDFTPDSSPSEEATTQGKPKSKESIKELIQREKCKYRMRMQSSEESLSQIKEKIKELASEDDTFMDSYSQTFAAAFDEDSVEAPKVGQSTLLTSNLNKPSKPSHKLRRKKKKETSKEDEKVKDRACGGCNLF
eukprot:TRINITY_DN2726_c0_g1_i4.p1 TRINITY_DN2726_c0_g1~~TRINITY_DN2726_c0_g1_i4.p1  ORF type:complete len:183 (+),score=65.82 TRINITY_DN2726_c0_g1_i4:171-719(+)